MYYLWTTESHRRFFHSFELLNKVRIIFTYKDKDGFLASTIEKVPFIFFHSFHYGD